MKRGGLSVAVMVATVVMALTVSTYAITARAVNPIVGLSFQGTTAVCHAKCFAGNDNDNGSDLSVSTILSSNDWRDYTMPLRTYNGYEFRYLDSYVDGETGYINVDDIGTVEWRKVVSSGLKALFPTVVSAAGAPVAGNALGVSITLSDTISPLSVRPNLTYSYSAVSYVKYNAIYRNYMRSFYISDKDNLIPGYDFYIVGAAEKVEVDNHISTRWPTIDSWDTYSGQVGSRHTISTPGFYGSSSFLSSLIQSYQLQRNYYENIELKKELINIILNSSY